MRFFLPIVISTVCAVASSALIAQSDTQVQEMIEALSTEDAFGRLVAFERLEQMVDPADRARAVERIWASSEDAERGEAVRRSLLLYLMTHADQAPGVVDTMSPLIAEAANSENTETRRSVLDIYRRRPPADPEDLYKFLEDLDDSVRAETISILWRRGERGRVRQYYDTYRNVAGREVSVERAERLLQVSP